MKFLSRLFVILSLSAFGIGLAFIVSAQLFNPGTIGKPLFAPEIWRRDGTVIRPMNPTDTLGSSAYRVNEGWFGTINVTTATITGISSSDLLPSTTNLWSLGNATSVWKNLFATNVSSTNATTTNLFATNATISNLTVSAFTPTNLTWTNATGTNTTSTNLFATNATISNLTVSSFSPTTLTWTSATGTNTTSTSLFVSGTASTSQLFVSGQNVCLANGTNCPASYSTLAITGLTFTTATGTTINLNSGGNIKVNEQNPRKTLTLSAAGGWPTSSAGATTATKAEVSSGLNYWASGFQPSGLNRQQWNVPMPDGYDGGTFTCSLYLTATATPSFTGACFSMRGVAIGDDLLSTSFGASSTALCVSHNWAANTQRVTSSTVVTLGNTPTGAKNIWLEVARDTDNASDTATNTIQFLNAECDYGVSAFTD